MRSLRAAVRAIPHAKPINQVRRSDHDHRKKFLSRGDLDHEIEIRYSGARFGGYHFEYVGIRLWLQTPPSGVLAWVLAWIFVQIFVQIFVFTGRWDARPPRSVERKLAGHCHRRPLALSAFGAVAINAGALPI
jgi:hypothetical protein